MKRRLCQFVLCCGIAGAAAAGAPEVLNTDSSDLSVAGASKSVTNPPAGPKGAAITAPAAVAGVAASPAAAVSASTNPPVSATASNTASASPVSTNSIAGDDANAAAAASPTQPSADTNFSNALAAAEPPPVSDFDISLDLARQERRSRNLVGAAQTLEGLLKTNAPTAIQRQALFELALVMQDDEQSVTAQQVWSQYLHVYSDDPAIPDVLLRQGILYRKMGLDAFAISKFYAVLSSALKLKMENLTDYKRLVVQAQSEIADTYFLDAKFGEAADFFNRILKSGDAEGSREQLEWKLIRALSYLTNHVETVGRAQSFLARYSKSPNVPEVRFLLAGALKNLGRNQDALQQVLLLLQSQQETVVKDPENWAYWQRRAGNEIANELYAEGDYVNALQLYLSLADLDKSPAWKAPAFYQVGMIYEQLQQWQKAADTYTRIENFQKELTPANTTPALSSLLEMAKWRKDYIAWLQKARLSDLALRPQTPTNSAPPAALKLN